MPFWTFPLASVCFYYFFSLIVISPIWKMYNKDKKKLAAKFAKLIQVSTDCKSSLACLCLSKTTAILGWLKKKWFCSQQIVRILHGISPDLSKTTLCCKLFYFPDIYYISKFGHIFTSYTLAVEHFSQIKTLNGLALLSLS